MPLSDYDPDAIQGTALCIVQPETEYDAALKRIYDWYVVWYRKRLDPPLPNRLLAAFRALAESEEDYREAVEIAIHLAHASAYA